MKTAVIYARVSSKEQEEGYSIDAQIKALRDYASSRGLTIIREFVEAETAKRAGRKEFNEMIRLVTDRDVRAILVEKTDRIYRNLKDRVTVDDLGVELHLVKENEILSKDSKSHAKFIHDIKLVVAKNYIDNLSEETRKGLQEKARQGIYPTKAPLGYLNVAAGTKKVIEVDPVRGPLVARLFAVYAEGRTSLSDLTKYAFDIGLRSKKGQRLLKSGIAHILQNAVYCGLLPWGDEVSIGCHTPLVTKEQFDKVQRIMHGRNRNNSGYGVRDFAYKGLFTCGHCGCALTAELKKGKYVYYHCTGNRGSCPKPFVREEVFTDHFAKLLARISIPDSVYSWLTEQLNMGTQQNLDFQEKQRTLLRREECRLKARLETIYLDKLEGEIPPDVYRSLSERVQTELTNVRAKIRDLEAVTTTNLIESAQLLELASTAPFRFKSAPNGAKREMLSYMCSNCSYDGQNIQVSLKEPFDIVLGLNEKAEEIEEWLPQ